MTGRPHAGQGPRRVLFLAEALFVGGREEVIALEAKHLDRARFEPVVCVLSDKGGAVAEELKAAGVEVMTLGWRTRRLSPVLLRQLGALVRREGISLLHAHDYKSALYARLLGRGRLPVVYSVHGIYERPRWKHHLINRLLARYTGAFIGVSAPVCEAIVRLDRLPPHKVRLLPNAVDTDRLRAGVGSREEVRRELAVAPGATLFATVARLEPDKGLHYLLEALCRMHENCSALIVGSGPEEGALRRRAAERGLNGRVVFAGMQRSLGKFLGAADAFVLPSRIEGMSVAVIEAMHLGLPVIASEVGGTASVVTSGEHGLLVPPGDVEALARAMEYIALNPDRAAEMGRAGQSRVEAEFLPRHHVAGLEALYDELLGCRACQGGL